MKDGIHPNYRDVCFMDLSNGFKFVTRSCANYNYTVVTSQCGPAEATIESKRPNSAAGQSRYL